MSCSYIRIAYYTSVALFCLLCVLQNIEFTTRFSFIFILLDFSIFFLIKKRYQILMFSSKNFYSCNKFIIILQLSYNSTDYLNNYLLRRSVRLIVNRSCKRKSCSLYNDEKFYTHSFSCTFLINLLINNKHNQTDKLRLSLNY